MSKLHKCPVCENTFSDTGEFMSDEQNEGIPYGDVCEGCIEEEFEQRELERMYRDEEAKYD